jgi:hypothetical protein
LLPDANNQTGGRRQSARPSDTQFEKPSGKKRGKQQFDQLWKRLGIDTTLMSVSQMATHFTDKAVLKRKRKKKTQVRNLPIKISS